MDRPKLDYELHQPAQDEWTFRGVLPLLVLLFFLCAIPLAILAILIYIVSGGAD